MLPRAAVKAKPGLNFLTPEIDAYTQERAPLVLRLEGTLDEDRLFRNLLSSMPMCFNLFGFFRFHPAAAARVLSAASGLDVAQVEAVDVEWTPDGAHPLGDRTAFDAWVSYRTTAGERGFLGVETKYTEPFSQRFYMRDRYKEVTAWPESGFTGEAVSRLAGRSTNQFWRNALLAAAVRRESNFDHGHVLVVALEDDPHVHHAMTVLEEAHSDPGSLVRVAPLERLMALALPEPELSSWAQQFTRRYLDLAPVRASI